MWAAWDLEADHCLSQLLDLVNDPDYEYKHSSFFTEQLTAFEVNHSNPFWEWTFSWTAWFWPLPGCGSGLFVFETMDGSNVFGLGVAGVWYRTQKTTFTIAYRASSMFLHRCSCPFSSSPCLPSWFSCLNCIPEATQEDKDVVCFLFQIIFFFTTINTCLIFFLL